MAEHANMIAITSGIRPLRQNDQPYESAHSA